MTTAISSYSAGVCPGKSTGSAQLSVSSYEATDDKPQSWFPHFFSADDRSPLIQCLRTREHDNKHTKTGRRIRLRRNHESSGEGAKQTQSTGERSGRRWRGPHPVRLSLCG